MKKYILLASLATVALAVSAIAVQADSPIKDITKKLGASEGDTLKITGILEATGFKYDNSDTGLNAKTIKEAIDEIGGKDLPKIFGSKKTSTWTGTIVDVCANQPRETKISVSVTPTNAVSGTWKSNDYSVFKPSMVCQSAEEAPRGTYTGSYRIAGNILLGYDITDPNGAALETGGSVVVEPRGNRLRVADISTNPIVVTILKKQ